MNKEQILKAFPDYEEISEKEYHELPFGKGCYTITILKDDINLMDTEYIYLKPKQKFPIVFVDKNYDVEVYEKGIIRVVEKWSDNTKQSLVLFENDSLQVLDRAIAKSKELRGLK